MVRDRAERRDLLDRLVGRSVLAEPDRIVRHDVDHAHAHQGGEADRAAAVVGEGEHHRIRVPVPWRRGGAAQGSARRAADGCADGDVVVP